MGKSSKDKRDAYYRLAKEQGWRARSAFKLLQLDEEFNLFEGVTRVVDLCAAPGSWSQVLSRVLIRGERFGRAAWVEKREGLVRVAAAAGEDGEARGVGETEVGGAGASGEAGDAGRAGESGGSGEAGEAQGEAGQSAKAQAEARQTSKAQDETTEARDDNANAEEQTATKTARTRRKDVKIVAIDLQPMSPLEGIITMRADITHPSTVPKLLAALDAPTTTTPGDAPATQQAPTTHHVDLLLTDGAPDVTGLHDLDMYIQASLLRSALALALRVLRPGGTFVAKIFRGRDCDLLYAQLRTVFADVIVAKPRASRASSLEAFVVARGFVLPSAAVLRGLGIEALGDSADPVPTGEHAPARDRTQAHRTRRADGVTELELGSSSDSEHDDGGRPDDHWVAPFLRCGDLSPFDFDADATYHLPPDHVSLEPVQPPTAPPYKRALEERRRMGGFYGRTREVGEANLKALKASATAAVEGEA